MRSTQYDWAAVSVGVAAHVAVTLVAILWANDLLVAVGLGPVVGGAVAGGLAHPTEYELRHGFLTGVAGLAATLVIFAGTVVAAVPSGTAAFFAVVSVLGALVVAAGPAAFAAGVSAAGAATLLDRVSESGGDPGPLEEPGNELPSSGRFE